MNKKIGFGLLMLSFVSADLGDAGDYSWMDLELDEINGWLNLW